MVCILLGMHRTVGWTEAALLLFASLTLALQYWGSTCDVMSPSHVGSRHAVWNFYVYIYCTNKNTKQILNVPSLYFWLLFKASWHKEDQLFVKILINKQSAVRVWSEKVVILFTVLQVLLISKTVIYVYFIH